MQDALEGRSVYTGEEGVVLPILKSGRFWLLSAQMFGVLLVWFCLSRSLPTQFRMPFPFTITNTAPEFLQIRESFASFVSAQINSQLHLGPGYSGMASSIFPAFGAISTLIGGFLLDRVRPNKRGLVPFAMLAGLTAALAGMYLVTPRDGEGANGGGVSVQVMAVNLAMIALVALSLYAPKIIFDGAFVMDLAGGSSRVGTVTAAVTGLGYLGGCVSPFVSGVIADEKGWEVAFLMLAGVAGVTCVCSGVYWVLDMRILRRTEEGGSA